MEIIKKLLTWIAWLLQPESLPEETPSSAAKPAARGFFHKKAAAPEGAGSTDEGLLSFLLKPERLEEASAAPKDRSKEPGAESFFSFLIKPETLPRSDQPAEKKDGFFSWLFRTEDLPEDSHKKV